MSADETWATIASSIGYETEKIMWQDLYLDKNWSIGKIAIRLGYSNTVVRRRMSLLQLPMRKKGGPNNRGKGRRILDRFDKNFVLNAPVKSVLEKANVTESTLWRYRRDERAKQAVTDLPNQPSEGA